jgi:hypothetical protein
VVAGCWWLNNVPSGYFILGVLDQDGNIYFNMGDEYLM